MALFNSKYKVIIAFAIFLIGFNCQTLWRWSQKDKKAVEETSQKQKFPEKIQILSYNMMEQMASTGVSVGLSSFLSQKDKKAKLMYALESGQLLAVRISPLSCSVCVDSTMISVRRFIKENNLNNRIIIFTSYHTERDLILFRRLHQIDFEVLNIIEDEITLPVEKHKIPYMFILDSSLISKSLFIPEKTILGLTDKYLESIKKYLN